MAAFSKPSGIISMLFTVFVLLQTVVASQHGHNAHMHPAHRSPEAMEAHFEETRSLLVDRANNIAITGVSGTAAPRLEIRELKKRGDQWNLFLLAMERFKAKDKNDRLSYYQIAGVHGRPFITWNNFGPLVNSAGFCPHNQCLFASWHRPYIAVFEQAMYQNAVEVVNSFPASQRGRWQNALNGLRFPYFDWAMTPPAGEPAVPTAIRDQTVTVTKPNGQVTIPNPLYSYSWGSSLPSEMGWGPKNGFPTTLRRPVDNPTRSNNNEMNALFGQARVGWRQRVFALFASKQNWGLATTSQYGVKTIRRSVDSFESIHDEIHGTAGGNDGHMSYLDVAAFDPIFWLHHTNIDRLVTMYQHVVNSYVADCPITRPMAQWNQGEPKNPYTPLKPFTKNTNGDYFTSMDVKITRTLGYFYPETSDGTYAQVVSAVNRLYRSDEGVLTKRDSTEDDTDGTSEYAPIYPGRPFKEGDYDTVLDVVGDKYALPGSYQVHCFLGAASNSTNSTGPYSNSTTPAVPSSNSTGYVGFPSSYVGSHTFLGGSMPGGGNGSYPSMASGCISLTAALQGKEASGELKSLHPDDVEPYLKEHLSYKVIGSNGVEIQPENIPNFHVQVKSCKVTPSPSEDELPSFADYTPLPRVSLPASAPWTYVPAPGEVPTPGGYPSSPSGAPGSSPSGYPSGSMPWDEPGYCESKQEVVYVNPAGDFLYKEMS